MRSLINQLSGARAHRHITTAVRAPAHITSTTFSPSFFPLSCCCLLALLPLSPVQSPRCTRCGVRTSPRRIFAAAAFAFPWHRFVDSHFESHLPSLNSCTLSHSLNIFYCVSACTSFRMQQCTRSRARGEQSIESEKAAEHGGNIGDSIVLVVAVDIVVDLLHPLGRRTGFG